MDYRILTILLAVSLVFVSGCVSGPAADETGTAETGADGTDTDGPATPVSDIVQDAPETGDTGAAGEATVFEVQENVCGNKVCEKVVRTLKKAVKETLTIDGRDYEITVTQVHGINDANLEVEGIDLRIYRDKPQAIGSKTFVVTDLVYDKVNIMDRYATIEFSEEDNCPADCAWECSSGQTRECGSDVGACESGVQTCVNSMWGECTGGTGPTEEVCGNNIDDDCDGEIDEGCEGTTEVVCGNGICESITLSVSQGVVKTLKLGNAEHRIEVESVSSMKEGVVALNYMKKPVYIHREYEITTGKGRLKFNVTGVHYDNKDISARTVTMVFYEIPLNCPEDCG